MTDQRVLVVDVGTSSVRVGVFDAAGAVLGNVERELLPDSPADGIVEFDARAMASTCLELAADAPGRSGPVGVARALPGAPPIGALLGDQQASLVGQGCVHPGDAKITFGTGGMLDVVLGDAPSFDQRGAAGTFPIVAWRTAGRVAWGIEA